MEYAMAELKAGKIPDFGILLEDDHSLLQSPSPQQVIPVVGGGVSDGSLSKGNGRGQRLLSPSPTAHHQTPLNNSSSTGGKIPKSGYLPWKDLLRITEMEDLLVQMISPVQAGQACKAGRIQYPSLSEDSSSDNAGQVGSRAKPLSAPDNSLSNLQNKSPKSQVVLPPNLLGQFMSPRSDGSGQGQFSQAHAGSTSPPTSCTCEAERVQYSSSSPKDCLLELQKPKRTKQGGGGNAGRGAGCEQSTPSPSAEYKPAPPPATGRGAGYGQLAPPTPTGRGAGHDQSSLTPAGRDGGCAIGRAQLKPPLAASRQPTGEDEGPGAEQGFYFTAHAGHSSVPSEGRGSGKSQGSPQDGGKGGRSENSSRGQRTTRGGQRSGGGGRDSRGGGRGGSRGRGGIGAGGGDGGQQGAGGGAGGGGGDEGGGGGGGGGDGQEEDEEERKKKEDDEREGKRKEEEALALLPSQPNVATHPSLNHIVTGLDAEAYKDHFRGPKNLVLGREQKKAINLRHARMTRPVYDPNHSLINYGHRLWPVDTSVPFIKNILSWIWPGPAGSWEAKVYVWDSDVPFCTRLTRLIEEFNAHGLPQTIHADLDHEIESTNTEAINPSYRCHCWISFLGEFWYNETDASLLTRLGRDWIISGQHLLIHILQRMITAMTHSYIKQSALTFGLNNPHLKGKYSTFKWPEVMLRLTDKLLKTHGYDKIAGQNRSLTDENQQMLAELCGIYKHQANRRLTRERYITRLDAGEGSILPRTQAPKSFTAEEMLYLDKYLLRRKLFNPQFSSIHIEEEFYDTFIRDVAVFKDKKTVTSRIIQYTKHFISDSLADSSRKGFKLRSEAISYYNLLVLKADGDAHIRYNTANPVTNKSDMVELAVSHMEAVMTERCTQILQGVRQITDFEAKDLANILNAINLENLTQLDLPELHPEGQAAVLPDAPHPATVHLGHQTPPASGSGSGRGGASTSSAATGTAGASTSGKKLQSKTVTQPGPAPEPILDEAAMQNFGPGSVQEQIQPILLDRALGEEHDLLCEAMRLILKLPGDPSSPGRHSSPPPPNQAFPDVYEELHQDHLNSAKRQKLVSEIASTSASQPPWGDPPGSPDVGGGGGSPPAGGVPGFPHPPPHPPSPPGGDDPRLAAFNNFYNDVANNFPDMIELVKQPILLADLSRYLDETEPRFKPYVYPPVNFPW